MVNNGQDANQSTFNNAFVSRTASSSNMLGSLDVGDTLSADTYKGLWKTYATQLIASAGTISKEDKESQQYRRVAGSLGAQTAANALFGDCSLVEDGAIIKIVGTNDIDTITIKHADVQYGAILNAASATLKKYYSLVLQYDSTLERWVEDRRNF